MWKHMSSSCRRSVEEKLVAGEELCETFGLDGLRYPSFQCASGFSRRTSAADVVFACGSLLESRGAAAGAAFGSSSTSDGSSAARAISTGDDPDNENRDAGAVDPKKLQQNRWGRGGAPKIDVAKAKAPEKKFFGLF